MRSLAFKQSISVGALALGLCVAASPAFAQETPPTTDGSQSPVEATTTPSTQQGEVQPTTLAAEPESAGNTVVVTGSRIKRPDFDTPNPVISIGQTTIEQSGTTNLTDFLTGYPALQGSSSSADNSGEDAGIGATGLNLLNLRNLGTDRTLVLVDGRRHVAGVPGSQAIDINTIPQDLVERVDVLTGGASAIYGADGVTGVVNFVMKDDFEGLTARVQDGISQHGDAGQRLFSITGGTNFSGGRGNVAVAYEHGEEDRLEFRDRKRLRGADYVGFYRNPEDPEIVDPDYNGGVDNGIPDYVPLRDVRYFDTNREGGVDTDLDYFPNYIVDNGGNVVPFDGGTYVPYFYSQGGNATRVADYRPDLLPEINRDVVNVLAHFDLTDKITLFGEGKWANIKSFSLSQPTFDYYVRILPDNAFLPEQIRAAIDPEIGYAWLNRDDFDYGQRGEDIDRRTLRGVLGLKGDISDHMNFEVSYVYGQTKVRNKYINDILNDRYYAALDAVVDPSTGQATCRINLDPTAYPYQPDNYTRGNGDLDSDGNPTYVYSPRTYNPGECVPLNPFGEGAPSKAALDFITADTMDHSKITQQVLSGSLAGDLGQLFQFPGGGELGYALGAEYRKETSSFVPDPLAAQGLTFTNALSNDKGKYNVKELFGELRLPLLKRLPFAYSLEIGGAARFSDYSTIGHTTTWKVDGGWAPIKDIRFVGTKSKAVRAPNIGELFAGRSQTYAFFSDPCLPAEIQNGEATRAANCAALLSGLGADVNNYDDSRSVNVPGFSGGNPDLRPETAKTWTAGVILQPSFIPGLTARADWYNIKLKDAVNTVDPQQVAELCVDQATLANPFCDAIIRQNGASGPAAAGNIISFNVGPENVAQFRTAGLDVNLNYLLRTANLGNFNLNVIGNYLDRLEFIGTIGAPTTDSRGEAFAPKYTVNSDLTWHRGRVTVNYGLNYFSKTSRFSNQTLESNPDVTLDKYKYYKEHWQHDIYAKFDVDKQFEMFGGINNLFNQKPDIGTNTYPVSSVGRYFYAGARIKLGKAAR